MKLLLISSQGQPLLAVRQLADRLRAGGMEVAVGGCAGADLPVDPHSLLSGDLARRVQGVGLLVAPAQVPALLQTYRLACRLAGVPGAPVFSGPCEPLSGDRLASDLLHRLEVDLICLHGPGEEEEALDLLRGTRFAAKPLVQLGLWSRPAPASHHDRAGTAVFLEQQGLPDDPAGQEPLLRLLARLAAASPSWKLLIQPTPASGGPDAGAAGPGLGDLIRQQPRRRWPPNLLALDPAEVETTVARAEVCLTISSPWIFHALAQGSRALVMGDYGIRARANLPLFFGSGLIHQFSALASLDRLPRPGRPRRRWLVRQGWEIADPALPLRHALSTPVRP